MWVDRAGVELETVYDRLVDYITSPSPAPDGRRIALSNYRPNSTGNIWILDPARNGETPVTGEGDNQQAVWSRSGRELAILSFGLSGESSVLRADSERAESARVWKAVPGLTNVVSWTVSDKTI